MAPLQKLDREEPRIKICGVTNIDDARLAVSLGADFIGVILDERVVRHGTEELLSDIRSLGVETVGVYTNMGQIENSELNEDVIQMHFPHSADDVKHLKETTDKKIISVIPFSNVKDVIQSANEFSKIGSDFILVERREGAYQIKDDISEIAKKVNIGIAGKITPETVEYFMHMGVELIDVSSSLESMPGKKDKDKLVNLFRNAGRVK